MPIEPLLLCGTATGVGDHVPTSPPKPCHPISLGLQALLDWNHILQVNQNPLAYERDDDFELVGAELEVDPPTVFCRPCRDLLRSPPEAGSGGYGEKELDWVPFHTDLFDLIDCCHNPKGNCPLCKQFWKSIKHVPAGFRAQGKIDQVSLPEQGLQVCLKAEKGFFSGRFDDVYTLVLNLVLPMNRHPFGIKFRYDDQGQRSSKLGLPFENCSDSITTFSRVEEWIRRCGGEHEQCKTNHDLLPPKPPARLVSIEPSGQHVRLEELPRPKEQEESQVVQKYTALSYRWSSRPSLTLKKSNLKEMGKLMSVSLLPKTLRDACV